MKKVDEDVMVLDDQNNKLTKVRMKRTITMAFQLMTLLRTSCENKVCVICGGYLSFTTFVNTGEEAAGGEDLRVHNQPGRGGGEIQEPAETQDQTRGHDHRPGR